MSAIREGLFGALTQHAGVAALAGARVYPVRLPQDPELPAVTYRKVSGPREHSHGGASGLADCVFEVTAWAAAYDAACGLADEVRKALDGLREQVRGVDIQSAFLEDEADDWDDDVQAYSVAMQFAVAFGEDAE